ncbi:amino acid deaminase/aldolase [Aeromicrobium duanguangcaii]|uniref:Amino acid deaminase/aldolase n=1 Tax=Aeromicrobium duanguangcaii TaxID=2968086 RepID=A0ABY5KFC9_9ACTN|nr:amino acid deaminase/aldolase [Aeromicrobium duanguangcaii]MCD9155193.1 amino acid deaminase/aldolase [Aeromicrobium duanguangcaii]UUI68156.1 amino acid deaminase/aldolase [Aeromicrobium duanguangcaii]
MAPPSLTPPYPRLLRATNLIDTPFAVIDEEALWANASDLVRRAHGVPIRLATKSIRVRSIIKNALTLDGFRGVMTYSLAESVWLADHGVDDILLAYPSVEREAYADLVSDERRLASITVMVDSLEALDLIDSYAGPGHPPIRVCLDVDASLRVFGAHLGAHRSPVHTTREAKRIAAQISERAGFDLVGLMFYDAQIAGLPDSGAAVRIVKRRSAGELRRRRRRIVKAVSNMTDLQIVNAGGTGSLDVWRGDSSITELAAGSGLFVPTLFDGYRSFTPRPAAFFALSVVRKPSRDAVTCFGGGYIASGPPGDARVPTPVWPEGLELYAAEGAGEVQTPLHGKVARSLTIGDRVLFRHAKAGEMCERFDRVALVDQAGHATMIPTYRGEGKNFG